MQQSKAFGTGHWAIAPSRVRRVQGREVARCPDNGRDHPHSHQLHGNLIVVVHFSNDAVFDVKRSRPFLKGFVLVHGHVEFVEEQDIAFAQVGRQGGEDEKGGRVEVGVEVDDLAAFYAVGGKEVVQRLLKNAFKELVPASGDFRRLVPVGHGAFFEWSPIFRQPRKRVEAIETRRFVRDVFHPPPKGFPPRNPKLEVIDGGVAHVTVDDVLVEAVAFHVLELPLWKGRVFQVAVRGNPLGKSGKVPGKVERSRGEHPVDAVFEQQVLGFADPLGAARHARGVVVTWREKNRK